MKRIFGDERGVITVYLLIILIAMVFFLGVLIDLSRISAAKKALEKAANASARSVLADYNPALRNYGLFGLNNKDKANHNFKDYLEENLAPTKLFDYKIERTTADTSLLEQSALDNRAVTEHQILDEMKYRAPIELTAQIIEAFRPISKMSENTDKGNTIVDLQQERDGLIQEARDEFSSALKNYSTLKNETYKDFDTAWNELDSLSDDKWKEESKDKLKLQLDNSIKENGIINLSNVMSEKLDNVNNKLSEAKRIDDQIIELSKKKDDRYSLPETNGTKINAPDVPDPTQVNTIYIGSAKFKEWEIITTEYKKAMDDINSSAQKLDDKIDSSSKEKAKTFNNKLGDARTYFETFNQKNKKFFDREPVNPTNEKDTNSIVKKEKENIESELKELQEQISEQFTQRDKLRNAIDYYKSVPISPKSNNDTPRKQIFSFLPSLFEKLKNIPYAARDELYVNEYVLSKFTNLTTDKPSNPDPITNHAMKNGEAEFVLYGNPLPLNNLAAAAGELFTVRLTINTIYHFTFSTDAELVSRILSSIILAAVDTAFDMNDLLIRKTPIKLMGERIKYVHAVKLVDALPRWDYTDYLRLFMLLQTNNMDQKIARIQSLISLNEDDCDLNPPKLLPSASTVGKFQAQVSIRLWFIPKVMKVLGTAANYAVNGDRVILTQEITASY
ncbi:hypothetical protein DP73_03790 [Desulfosporosinus sp. HMP52]|uniref:TadE/TadG family type IV pilus assembly protein n=1 Tax=Desulfosporosinus sp. HMP52 TaxID=1487923 RepID=UPI00051FA4C9|nr:DUF5702 domain-containing protein [Desulfosporosinus sp. HMP52]KGK91397.1 hypothetical protein DP73_03790 [Desulfosporosinus sp. HMP52]